VEDPPEALPAGIGSPAVPREEFGGIEALLDLAPDVAEALEELPPEALEAIADIPLALVASEIALAEAEVALMARQGAVEALRAATAVPALYLLRPGIHTVVPLRRDLI